MTGRKAFHLSLFRNNEKYFTHRLRTPPSREALRHSGGERRRWTSATVTLYLEVELSSDSRPGTEQKTSVGAVETPESRMSLGCSIRGRIPAEDSKGTELTIASP